LWCSSGGEPAAARATCAARLPFERNVFTVTAAVMLVFSGSS
jgi:hypothetical protein